MIAGIVASDIVVASGGGGYSAHAVQADNSDTSVNNYVKATLAEADGPNLTLAWWMRSPDTSFIPTMVSIGGSGGGIGFNFTTDVSFVVNNGGSSSVSIGTADGVFTPNVWHHIFLSFQTNHAANAKLKNLWVDGVDAHNGSVTVDGNASFNIKLHSQEFGLPANAANITNVGTIFEFADFWMDFSYLDPASNIAAFRDPTTGKPVNLGANGETPTNTPPAFFLTGNASTFVDNAGSGDALTLTGTFTDFSSRTRD